MNDDLIKLSIAQIKQIQDRGYTFAMTPSGLIKVTKDDLYFIKEEVEACLKEFKKNIIESK